MLCSAHTFSSPTLDIGKIRATEAPESEKCSFEKSLPPTGSESLWNSTAVTEFVSE